MLSSCLARVKPRNWKITEEENGNRNQIGVTECWISFETGAARGFGLIRLQNGQILDAFDVGRTEGSRRKGGLHPAAGTPAQRRSRRQNLEGIARRGNAQLGMMCSSSAAARRHLARRAVAPARHFSTIILEKNERAGNSWRNRYKSGPPRDRCRYDHFLHVPNWPVFSPKEFGDWLDVHQGHGAELLDRHHGQTRELEQHQKGSGTWSKRHSARCTTTKQLVFCDRHVRQAEHAAIRGSDSFNTTPPRHLRARRSS